MILSENELQTFLKGQMGHPHFYLGLHPCEQAGQRGLVARAFVPRVASCEVVSVDDDTEARYPLEKIHPDGFFEGFIADRTEPFRYRFRVEKENGEIRQFFDPYSFEPTLGDLDVYLINEGNDVRIYDKLGAHLRTVEGVPGVAFAVWAPAAKSVSVVGEFNHWDRRYHPMRYIGESGIWELFIPGVEQGEKYKYEIVGPDGFARMKIDPYATFFEGHPHNASVVWPVDDFEWEDDAWIAQREHASWKNEPLSVYEVHLDSWRRVVEDGNRPLTYRELAVTLTDYVRRMGYTHVEFMPLSEHPFLGSWGYQVTGFFAPTHRYGTPDDFAFLVNTLHKNGIGVIMDWVPGHFPKDSWALARYDGTHLYEHSDPRQGEHRDWGTLIFNYGRHEVRNFLTASALAWCDRYHIDGLRVDAVASMLYLDYSREEGDWIPNKYGGRENIEAMEFLRSTNDLVHKHFPGVLMIAEESTSWGMVTKPPSVGGLGFDFKWNMGWMHDTLQYFSLDPIYRRWHQNDLTFGMLYQYSEDFIQVFSHDEVVHGKQSMILKQAAGSMTDKAQSLRGLYTLMWAWPGKKTLFMGQDFGQSSEWRYDLSLDWHLLQYKDHSGVLDLIRDLNRLLAKEPLLYKFDHDPQKFRWISCNDAEGAVFSFLRFSDKPDDVLAVIGHYTPVERHHYRIGVPLEGEWVELINSADAKYGGYGNTNGTVHTDNVPFDGHPYSVELVLAPLSTFVLKYKAPAKAKKKAASS